MTTAKICNPTSIKEFAVLNEQFFVARTDYIQSNDEDVSFVLHQYA